MNKEIKLKAVKAEKGSSKPGITFSCKGCLGNNADNDCLKITELAIEQGLPYCTQGYIYLEDSEIKEGEV